MRDHYPNLHLWLRRLYWDKSERTHGAFEKTTFPWIQKYKLGYGESRQWVLGITGPLIIPKGPRVPVHELEGSDAR